MKLFSKTVIVMILFAHQIAYGYNEKNCKSALDYRGMLEESKDINGHAKSIIDIAKRLDTLDPNANTDFYIAGVYASNVVSNIFQLSYAIRLLQQADNSKLSTIGNNELFKTHVSNFANSIEPTLNIVANHYVVEKKFCS